MVRYPRLWLTLLYAVLAIAWGWAAAATASPARYALFWAAAACLLVGGAYALDRPGVFGKRRDGTLDYLVALAALPVLLALHAIWALRLALAREPAYHEIVPGLLLGRRVAAAELPSQVDLVLDLTAEFAEPSGVRADRVYHAIPALDGVAPPLRSNPGEILRAAAAHPGTVYVHCAYGHGRAVAAAACLLVLRGVARDADHAFALIRTKRRRIFPSGAHRAFVTAVTSERSRVCSASGPGSRTW